MVKSNKWLNPTYVGFCCKERGSDPKLFLMYIDSKISSGYRRDVNGIVIEDYGKSVFEGTIDKKDFGFTTDNISSRNLDRRSFDGKLKGDFLKGKWETRIGSPMTDGNFCLIRYEYFLKNNSNDEVVKQIKCLERKFLSKR